MRISMNSDLQVPDLTCESGCYCPLGQYEDHRGNCVALDNCTCVYGGKVFSAGELVRTNCKAWYDLLLCCLTSLQP